MQTSACLHFPRRVPPTLLGRAHSPTSFLYFSPACLIHKSATSPILSVTLRTMAPQRRPESRPQRVSLDVNQTQQFCLGTSTNGPRCRPGSLKARSHQVPESTYLPWLSATVGLPIVKTRISTLSS